MSQNPLFTIIAPTYNRGYILWKTIQSIQNQSWPHWELLVIDDGSTDDTKKMIREFQSDPRICYFYKLNEGPSSARNWGLDRASGDIITYVDSDDQVFPNYLLTAKNYFSQFRDKTYAHANANRKLEYYDEEGLLKSGKNEGAAYEKEPTLEDYYDGSVKPSLGTGFFHRHKLFKGKIQWNESLRLLENLDFLMQLAVVDPFGFLYIPSVLYEYKQKYGGDGLCSNASHEQWADAFSKIHALHERDPLMKNPGAFLEQTEKHRQMQQQLQTI
jgi:glycosyltransferase involved in cell wall biosynthesis